MLPPSQSALNLRSASAGSATVSETEKPCGLWKCSGGASDAISTWPPIEILACMICFFRSGGDGISGGASSFRSIISILPPSALS